MLNLKTWHESWMQNVTDIFEQVWTHHRYGIQFGFDVSGAAWKQRKSTHKYSQAWLEVYGKASLKTCRGPPPGNRCSLLPISSPRAWDHAWDDGSCGLETNIGRGHGHVSGRRTSAGWSAIALKILLLVWKSLISLIIDIEWNISYWNAFGDLPSPSGRMNALNASLIIVSWVLVSWVMTKVGTSRKQRRKAATYASWKKTAWTIWTMEKTRHFSLTDAWFSMASFMSASFALGKLPLKV